ncbi:MAG: nucleoside monophosphate kinase [Vicinamibacterales bacterium]
MASAHVCSVLLMGPPGSGKGTQALRIAEHYRIPHISTGDLLRRAVKSGSELGRQVSSTLASGGLVGDDVMVDLVRGRLADHDAACGCILDGFPRTVAQATALDQILQGTLLIPILVDVQAAVIAARLASRRVCASCTLTQSVLPGSGPGEDDPCAYCGGRLVRRADDGPAIIARRLAAHEASAKPLIDLYARRPGFGIVDGAVAASVVTRALVAHIDRVRTA